MNKKNNSCITNEVSCDCKKNDSNNDNSLNNSCSQSTNLPKKLTIYNLKDNWIIGEIKTTVGMVPKVSTSLVKSDKIGAVKARFGINRMDYKINPGLYAVGNPDQNAIILVTSNYKLTFDSLRKELDNLNLWILVLDTNGINVWCAAGKGTFGTDEIINRINKTKLLDIVSHRNIILPQLGAPGVIAHEITQKTGFKVVYGPVRACDIKEFINLNFKASNQMRIVNFSIWDRLVLIPIEIASIIKISMIIFGILFLINLFAKKQFGAVDLYLYLGAVASGCVLTPILLPIIPGRAFAWKGWLVGFIWVISFCVIYGVENVSFGLFRALGYILVIPAMSAFAAMNFTGASTYTSLSGVLKEMKIAIPFIVVMLMIGITVIITSSMFNL